MSEEFTEEQVQVRIWQPQDYVLTLVNGEVIRGTVTENFTENDLITVVNPRRLKVPYSYAGGNEGSLAAGEFIKSTSIWIQKTSIVYWAIPSELAYRL